MSEPVAVWQGRLARALDPRAQRLNDSLDVDRRLWPEELLLTRAYAETLAECGVLDAAGLAALLGAAESLGRDLEAGRVALAGEDVHSAVEAELTKRCGDPARRLHTGRSRNDQVSTLTRLRVMRLCDEAVEGLKALERALVLKAREAGDLAAAAHTHLQPAQPVLLAQLWLAHAHALERDEARFEAAREAADSLPLGAGAVAGTPLRYDRLALAARLGFSRLSENSVDVVGDRDFALEYLNASSLLGVHLSRLAEDLVLWCAPAFGWFTAPDGFSTGSSLLPQKRNPDVFELTRGKAARLMSNAQRLATVMKGLPSAYQKDLQEDKEALFDTGDTLDLLLAALPPAISALVPNAVRIRQSLTADLLAVELADALVERGVPFRDAHAAVGRLWALAESLGVEPAAIPHHQRLSISPHFDHETLEALTIEAALERRSHAPGGGPESVKQQLARMEARLGLGEGAMSVDPGAAAEASEGEGGGRTAAGGAPEARRSQEGGGVPRTQGGGAGSGADRAARDRPPAALVPKPEGASAELQPDAPEPEGAGTELQPDAPEPESASAELQPDASGLTLRRATLKDVPGIARIMSQYVAQGVLLPRPVSELFQCIREFHVAEANGQVVACCALRLLWDDLGEVRSLAVRPDHHGQGLGGKLVAAALEDARALGVPRVIALTREVPFFERCGFIVISRDRLPRKVWSDCVRCPRRHACDEVAVVCDLVPGATEAADAAAGSWLLPIPQLAKPEAPAQPVVS